MIFHSCGLHVVHGSEHGRYVLSYTKGICLHICYLDGVSNYMIWNAPKIGHTPDQFRLLVLTDTVSVSTRSLNCFSLQRQDLKI